jgi:hypothetical protein
MENTTLVQVLTADREFVDRLADRIASRLIEDLGRDEARKLGATQ